MKKEVMLQYGIGLDTKVWFFSILQKEKSICAFIIDETVIQIGNSHYWLWIAIEPVHRTLLLGMHISNERKICL